MSKSKVNRPYIGVAVMIWDKDKVLLGKRKSTYADGCWQFPGGHLEFGESVVDCAAREVEEETGLAIEKVTRADYTSEVVIVGERHYVTLFVTAKYLSGSAILKEPEKCRGWQWFHYLDLPDPLFIPIQILLASVSDLSVFRPNQDS